MIAHSLPIDQSLQRSPFKKVPRCLLRSSCLPLQPKYLHFRSLKFVAVWGGGDGYIRVSFYELFCLLSERPTTPPRSSPNERVGPVSGFSPVSVWIVMRSSLSSTQFALRAHTLDVQFKIFCVNDCVCSLSLALAESRSNVFLHALIQIKNWTTGGPRHGPVPSPSSVNDLSLRVLKSNFLKAQISSAVIFFLSRTFSISPSVESRRTIANGDPHIVSDGDSGGGGGRELTQQVVFSVAAVPPPPPPPPSQFLPSFLGGVMIILPPSYNTINFSRQNDTKRERV